MALDIIHYLRERYPQKENGNKSEAVFVTISRETGCHSRAVAELLQKEIHSRFQREWSIINKETVLDAANTLHLNPLQVQHLLNAEDKGNLEEILLAFGEDKYKSYQSVRNTVRDLIIKFAHEGNRIIIGRAGAIITSELSGGLHVRLVAPLQWRIKSIGQQKQLSEKEAKLFVEEMDVKRNRLFKVFCGKDLSNNYFDLIYNNARFSDEEIAHSILMVLVNRYKF